MSEMPDYSDEGLGAPFVVVADVGDGRYHLRALPTRHQRKIVHLTDGVVLDDAIACTPDPNVLAIARGCIVVGELNAWTRGVADHAEALGVPLIFSQLAIGVGAALRDAPRFAAVTTIAESERASVAVHTNTSPDAVVIVGAPGLDARPPWNPIPNRVLVLPSVSCEQGDECGELRATADALVAGGFDVVVRPHPREDLALWRSFRLDLTPNVLNEAARAMAVVGHPTTAFTGCAALGVPIAAVVPAAMRLDPIAERLVCLAGAMVTPATVVDEIGAIAASDPSAVAELVGPLGGAADRLVAVWERAARSFTRTSPA